MAIYLTLGEKMKMIREQLGISSTMMSKKLGCSTRYYLDLEMDKVLLNEDVESALDKILNVNMHFIYNDIEKGLNHYEIFMNYDIHSSDIDTAGDRLRLIRKERKLLQKELAEMVNMKRINISQLENGSWKMTEKIAIRLADALNVGYRWLLYGIEREKNYPCNQDMINYLNSNEKVRKTVFDLMNKKNQ